MPTFLGYQRVVVVRCNATHNGILFSSLEYREFRKKKGRCLKARNGWWCLIEKDLKNLTKRLESANAT